MALHCRGVTNWHLAQLTSAQVSQITAVLKWGCQASVINHCYCMSHPTVWNLRKWWTSHLRTSSMASLTPEWLHTDEETWEATNVWKTTCIQNSFQVVLVATSVHNETQQKKHLHTQQLFSWWLAEVHQNKCQSNSATLIQGTIQGKQLLYVFPESLINLSRV